jgi:redox-sensitive bicupin YhaK (pirin superfamily)
MSLPAENVPVVRWPGVKVRVPLGGYHNAHSPLAPPNEVSLLDISLEEGSELAVPVMAGHNAFVMPIHGALTIDGQRFDSEEPRVPVLRAGSDSVSVTLHAPQGRTKAMLFSGLPLHQPVHWRGSMAMASTEALASAVAAYRRGEFGTL